MTATVVRVRSHPIGDRADLEVDSTLSCAMGQLIDMADWELPGATVADRREVPCRAL